jgi:predicted SprT family Zn-dependent metalloprotease
MQQAIRKESPNRQYVTLSAAFDFFNRRLFAGELPAALITMQRHAGARGYYSAKRFEGRGGPGRETDELALNPGTFKDRTDAEILSTLVHEMVHHWQAHCGNPGRGRYHNEQWAKRMEQLGLMPSDTGQAGGRRVGQRVTHYVVAGGRFDQACGDLLAGGARVEWQSRENEATSAARARSNRSKTKYTCPGCGVNAWAKPDVRLLCVDCGEELEAEAEG